MLVSQPSGFVKEGHSLLLRRTTLIYSLTNGPLETCRTRQDTYMSAIRILQSKMRVCKRPWAKRIILPFDSAAVAWSLLYEARSGSTFPRVGIGDETWFKDNVPIAEQTPFEVVVFIQTIILLGSRIFLKFKILYVYFKNNMYSPELG